MMVVPILSSPFTRINSSSSNSIISSSCSWMKSKSNKICPVTTLILLLPILSSLMLLYYVWNHFDTVAILINTDENNYGSFVQSLSSSSSATPSASVASIATVATVATVAATESNNSNTAVQTVPSCDQASWKSSENLIGSCPGGLKPYKSNQKTISMENCAIECCQSDACITWQYRADIGCLHGGDIRLGQEKDGPSSWCSDIQPKRWQGQYVLQRSKGHVVANHAETGGCSVDTWNPHEQEGQCFGLGDVKQYTDHPNSKERTPILSAQQCMEACCTSVKLNGDCGAWQYSDALGCFYHKRMHGCVDVASNPIVFEPYIGRRKYLPSSRKYTDKHGQPWTQQQ